MQRCALMALVLVLGQAGHVLGIRSLQAQPDTDPADPSKKAWVALACDADCSTITAGGEARTYWTAPLWQSTDGARHWGQLFANKYFGFQGLDVTSLATSADAATLLYVVQDKAGQLFDLPNLSMLYKFTPGAAPVALRDWGYWTAVAAADAGCRKLVLASQGSVQMPVGDVLPAAGPAAPKGDKLWLLDTAGSNAWQQLEGSPVGLWSAVAASKSDDGATIVAAQSPGHLFVSSDGGKTFQQRLGETDRRWVAVAASADGRRLLAAAADGPSGGLFLSTDAGATWAPAATGVVAAKGGWAGVAIGGDGQRMAAVQGAGVHLSKDGGSTWVKQATGSAAEQPAAATRFRSVACSQDCETVVVGEEVLLVTRDGGATWGSLK